MSDLHAVFRSVGERWDAYSRPVSIHVGGATLDEARDEFTRAAKFHFGEDWAQVEVRNHIERPILPDVYVRVAVDRHTLEREHTAAVLRASLTVPAQMEYLRDHTTEASTGDVVFVACMAADLLDWVIAQLGRTDALQVCSAVGDDMLWWTTLAAPDSDYHGDLDETETLGDAGLASDSATVADLIRADHVSNEGVTGELAGGTRTLMVSR